MNNLLENIWEKRENIKTENEKTLRSQLAKLTMSLYIDHVIKYTYYIFIYLYKIIKYFLKRILYTKKVNLFYAEFSNNLLKCLNNKMKYFNKIHPPIKVIC